MASTAEWSIPALESKGFPKKEGLRSFSTSVGKTGDSFEVQKTVSLASHFLQAAMLAKQTIPLIDIFFEREERGQIVTYAKFSFRECRVAEIRYYSPQLVHDGSSRGSQYDSEDLESIKVNFGAMAKTYGKDFGPSQSSDNWKE